LDYAQDGPVIPLNAIRFKKFRNYIVAAELKVDGSGGRVVRIKEKDFSKQKIIADNLAVPIGLAATDDDLWVADWYLGMVFQLVKDGKVLRQPIPVAKDLSFPEGLALDQDGTLLVAETGSGAITRIDPLTGVKSTVATGLDIWFNPVPGWPPTWGFNGLTVGESGSIYIMSGASTHTPRLLRLRPRH
jgi:streptogramin lyase